MAGFLVASYGITLKRGSLNISCHPSPTGSGILSIKFWPDFNSAPANESIIEPNHVVGRMHVPAERFPWYVDILRNEKPIWAHIDENPDFNDLRLGPETVGEGET